MTQLGPASTILITLMFDHNESQQESDHHNAGCDEKIH